MLEAKSFPGNGITLAAIAGLGDCLALLARQLALRSFGNGGFHCGRVCRHSNGYDAGNGIRDRGRSNTTHSGQRKDNQDEPSHFFLQFAIATPMIMTTPPRVDIGVGRSPRKIAAKMTPTIGVR